MLHVQINFMAKFIVYKYYQSRDVQIIIFLLIILK